MEGVHTIQLVVTDNGGAQATDTVVFTVLLPGPSPNQPPKADAGPGQTITDTDNNGFEIVSLNGAGSSDPDGSITSYIWFEDNVQIATGATPSVNLGVGVHTIQLIVTDNSNASVFDTVVLTVVPLPPPTAAFSTNVLSGSLPLTAQFTSQSIR